MVVFGHTLEQYKKEFGKKYENGELWDFSIEDFTSGAVEFDPKRDYWVIDDRVYEVPEE